MEEHTGVCHGIALSMCYGNQGYIDFDDITSGAHDYWTLGSPYREFQMKDMILYYQMTQCSWTVEDQRMESVKIQVGEMEIWKLFLRNL